MEREGIETGGGNERGGIRKETERKKGEKELGREGEKAF